MSSTGIINSNDAARLYAAAMSSAPETTGAEFPPGMVQVEREGAQRTLQAIGGVLAIGGAALLGASLLTGRASGSIESRLKLSTLLLGGGMVGLGSASVIGSDMLPPGNRLAVATKIPTRTQALEIAGTYEGRLTKVVQDTDGTFAVLDEGPARNSSDYGYERGKGHYYGDGHYHGQHYQGDGHYHPGDYYPEPYDPGSGDYYPIPYDPSPSRNYPGGGTSSGDDSGSSYNPPPSYDPPSYDPPSYDPPSSDSGNSSSNGNPSYDDF